MSVRAIDENHDWTFGKGKGNYLLKDDAIKQNIETRILSWKYDCFFAQGEGIDWKRRLDKNQASKLEEDLRVIITQTEGVSTIDSFSLTILDRKFIVNYEIRTENSSSIKSELEKAI